MEQKRSGLFCLKKGKMHETMSDAAAACRKSQKRRDADERQSPLMQVRSLDCHRGCCQVPRRYMPLLSFTQMFHSFPFQRHRSSPTSHPTVSYDRAVLPLRKERLSHRPDLLDARRFFFIHEEARVHLLLSSSSLWLHSSIFLGKLYHP